jgi:MFS family permease
MTPILGRVGDMMGKKRVFVATLVALAAGSLMAAADGAGERRGSRRLNSQPERR